MSAKYRPTFLSLLALLYALTLSRNTVSPQNAKEFLDRGVVKVSKNDLDGAIVDQTTAIELNPKYAFAYVSRGNAKNKKWDLAEADEDFAQAAKLGGR